MVPLIKNNLDKIHAACKVMDVQFLYLFGSGAREKDFTEQSDLDFLFKFKNIENPLLMKYDYLDLLFTLEEITQKKVDLVAEERITNEYFMKLINEEKVKVYEA